MPTTMMLQRQPDLKIRIRGSEVLVSHAGRVTVGDANTLAILDAFATPVELVGALRQLASRARSADDFVALNAQVTRLREHGVIAEPTSADAALVSDSGRFDAAAIHVRMLDDVGRTDAFRQALAATIRPTDIVLDIGTGTGVLAALAARAGARHVYAIERTGNFPRMARDFFRRNGLADRITIVEGDSRRVSLPEPANVLVTETIGNDPLNEGIVRTVADARKRLLASDARIIPSRLRVFAIPVELPEGYADRVMFTPEGVARWRAQYGLDFTNYAEHCGGQAFTAFESLERVRHWRRLAEPSLVADVDLHVAESAVGSARRDLRWTHSGHLGAVLLYFEADLGPEVSITTHPDRATPENSWAAYLWIPGHRLEVTAGDRTVLTYSWDGQRSSCAFGD